MIIRTASFAYCVGDISQLPSPTIPEIAFAGRSNVGKSSLINSMLRRKNLARASGAPGKTQTLNFYLVNDSFYLVDLPGYGFAQAPKQVRQHWQRLIEAYLGNREALAAVVLVVDSRHEPSPLDIQMHSWLQHYNKPSFTVATKMDKLRSNQRQSFLKRLATAFGPPIIPHSSVKESRQEELWEQLKKYI